jgi:hypothetical protein
MMKISLAIVLFVALSPGSSFARPAQADTAAKEFQSFWTEFRQAIMANDKEKVASMTRFPFKTRGTMDSDPVKKRAKESFLNILDKLLQTDPGLSAEPGTMRQLIERQATVTSKEVTTQNFARVGDFVFEKAQGKWLFTMAFWDE